VRPVGQALNAAINLTVMFLAEQFYLSLLCALHFGVWLVFGGSCMLGMLGVACLLPETKGEEALGGRKATAGWHSRLQIHFCILYEIEAWFLGQLSFAACSVEGTRVADYMPEGVMVLHMGKLNSLPAFQTVWPADCELGEHWNAGQQMS
jgi:hypothetical protein